MMFNTGDVMENIFSEILMNIFENGKFKEIIPNIINPEELSYQNLNLSFLVMQTHGKHPQSENAKLLFDKAKKNDHYKDLASFFENAVNKIYVELEQNCINDKYFKDTLSSVNNWFAGNIEQNDDEFREQLWELFFPEGVGIFGCEDERIKSLRAKRKVKITSLNKNPVSNPGRQIIFTSNVLLSLPPASKAIDELPIDDDLKFKLKTISKEKQKYWFDHPVQIGVAKENNEILYGLKALDDAIDFEKKTGNFSENERVVCVLSISVTHDGLHEIGVNYLQKEIIKSGGLNNLEVYCFSETDTQKIINDVLIPIASNNNIIDSECLHEVFGVDGKYGRHYSFLKAIAAFWNVFVDPDVIATFKIDLDQVFPQNELVKETGLSVFEHFKTPLWSNRGRCLWEFNRIRYDCRRLSES